MIVDNPTPEQLQQAAAWNHREWFCLNALASGGEVREAEGVTWTYAGPEGSSGRDAMVAFPVLAAERAGAQLDEIVAYYRRLQPRGVGCWSLEPPQPDDLGARLLARGFRPGWRPCWMALDLQHINTSHPRPEGLIIKADNESAIGDVAGLPYATPKEGGACQDVAQQAPSYFQRFIAILNDKIVAHSAVLLSADSSDKEKRYAGIYDVGVVPEARNQGIGKAIVLAACSYAKEHGRRYALLNATGRRMYEQIGFTWIGDGWTWWLNVPRLVTHPPAQEEIALIEALCTGDVETLTHLGSDVNGEVLQRPVTNGMTPLELAVHCQQPASAKWLLAQGVPLDALAAWDLGWKEQAAQLLADHPQQVNTQQGEWGATMLHIAAERNDVELARLALSANPDLNLKDKSFQGTPLGWAKHMQRTEIIRLIEAHPAK